MPPILHQTHYQYCNYVLTRFKIPALSIHMRPARITLPPSLPKLKPAGCIHQQLRAVATSKVGTASASQTPCNDTRL